MLKKIKNKLHTISDNFRYGLYKKNFAKDLSFTESASLFASRNLLHAYMHHYYIYLLPDAVKKHRNYFKKEGRGYGENAFHSMWWLIFREFTPKKILEIGVYRGQTLTLFSLLSNLIGYKCDVHGLSPFSPAGDTVSKYLKNLNYKNDIESSANYFNIKNINLYESYSNDDKGLAYINSNKWDLIYIDGNHDYDVVLSDYKNSLKSLAIGGILVLDDSSLYTDYKSPAFSFSGHPGPSLVMRDQAMNDLKFIGGVGHNNIFIKLK